MTAWAAESLPPELVALHDAPGGTSLTGLAGIINAYDALRTTAPTGSEEEPHRLSVRLIPLRGPAGEDLCPQPYRELRHTEDCDRLKYGQRCPFDDFEGPGGGSYWPTSPGEYEGWFWSSRSWTDAGWEYDAGIDWQRADTEPGAAQSGRKEP